MSRAPARYKHGGSFYSTLRALLREGGISRLYQGLQWAIIQAAWRKRRREAGGAASGASRAEFLEF